jgi:hypothetical protein
MARNLAATSDLYAFLDLDERANFGFISNLTTIEIDEAEKAHVFPQLDVWGNAVIGLHTRTDVPWTKPPPSALGAL